MVLMLGVVCDVCFASFDVHFGVLPPDSVTGISNHVKFLVKHCSVSKPLYPHKGVGIPIHLIKDESLMSYINFPLFS